MVGEEPPPASRGETVRNNSSTRFSSSSDPNRIGSLAQPVKHGSISLVAELARASRKRRSAIRSGDEVDKHVGPVITDHRGDPQRLQGLVQLDAAWLRKKLTEFQAPREATR